VIKEILYDPFSGVLEDTQPEIRIPLGFAGGLHDPDLNFVRFGWRDYDPFTCRWTAPDPMGDAGGDDDWYGYCLDDPVNLIDPIGLMGSRPEPPKETELHPSGDYQWQTGPKACDKCSWYDGNYYSPGSEPKRPHLNCKCELIECFYGSEYTKWETIKEITQYNYPNPVVFPFSLNVVPIWWEKITTIKERRLRTSFKLCGERKDILGKQYEYNERIIDHTKKSNANRSQDSSIFWTNNPWQNGDTRYGEIKKSF